MNTVNLSSIGAPPFSREEICRMAERLTKIYVDVTKPHPALVTINFDHVYEHYIYPEYEIRYVDDADLGHDDAGHKILGMYDLETNTAYVDKTLDSRDPRRAFTCWHEVGGHGILQGDWLREQLLRRRRSPYIVTTDEGIDLRTQVILERQANLFAAHAAAPTWLLRHVIKETYEPTHPLPYVGPATYSLIVRGATVLRKVGDFDTLCRLVARYISWRFGGLSLEALGYRIAELGFVVDVSRPRLHLRRVAPIQTVNMAPTTAPMLASVGS